MMDNSTYFEASNLNGTAVNPNIYKFVDIVKEK